MHEQQQKIIHYLINLVEKTGSVEMDFSSELQHFNNSHLLEILLYAEKNGLSYFFLQSISSETEEYMPVLINNRWNVELKKLEVLKKTLQILHETLTESGIPYLLIKACTTIPHVPRDLDIYVNSRYLPRVIEEMRRRGYSCSHSDSVDTTLSHPELLNIDIYTGLFYCNFEFFDEKYLVQEQRDLELCGIRYSGISDEANLLLTFVHSVFGHRSMSLLDYLHVRSLLRQIPDLNHCSDYPKRKGWGNAYQLILNEFSHISQRIDEQNPSVRFPYLFHRKFIVDCINAIDGIRMSWLNIFFFHISLFEDYLTFKAKDSIIYNLMRSNNFTRKAINSYGYFLRRMRGDKRSN